jgi:hypothetical protein
MPDDMDELESEKKELNLCFPCSRRHKYAAGDQEDELILQRVARVQCGSRDLARLRHRCRGRKWER